MPALHLTADLPTGTTRHRQEAWKTAAAIAYAVRGHDGRVVLIFWGAEASNEVRSWTEKGYRVDRVDRSLLDE